MVHQKFFDFASITDLGRLRDQLVCGYVRAGDFDDERERVGQIAKTVDLFCVKKDEQVEALQYLQEQLQLQIEGKISEDQLHDHVDRVHEEVVDEIEHLHMELADTEKRRGKNEDDIKAVKRDLAGVKADLKNKTYNEETVRIWQHFNTYAEYADLKDLYNKVLPELGKFEEKLVEQNRDNMKVQEIISRFDEVISEKASKQNVREVYDKLEDYVSCNQLLDYKSDNNRRLAELADR